MPGIQFRRAQTKILIVREPAVHRQNVQGFALWGSPGRQSVQPPEGVVTDEFVRSFQNQVGQALTIPSGAHFDF